MSAQLKQSRAITVIVASALLLYVALSAALGWWLRDRLLQTELPDWTQLRLQAGWFHSDVDLVSSTAAPLNARFSGHLQHGPLLRQPWPAGLLRLHGKLTPAPLRAAPDDSADTSGMQPQSALRLSLQSGFSGHSSAAMDLPQWLDLSQQPAQFGGPVAGTVDLLLPDTGLHGGLQHATGLLCLPELNLRWRELDWRLRLQTAADWLQSGDMTLAAEELVIAQADRCRLVAARGDASTATLAGLRLQLGWPERSAIALQLIAAGWQAADTAIGPLQLEVTLAHVDRAVLTNWLQAAQQHRRQPAADQLSMAQLALAAQTAELLQQRPLLQLHALLLRTAAGDFELSGEVELRPGGLRAQLQGETTAAAATAVMTVLLQDQAAAERMLQAWRRQGLVQELDGRWLINVVVNR
ncbi:MAG: hypothetical protein Tsb0027_25660 [Wenzhouxiangellaceae bacterium]